MLVGTRHLDEGILIVDGKDTADVRCCPHCGMPFAYIKGSGKIRGICSLCPGRILCGSVRCLVHSEIERRIEGVEEGRLPLSAL